MPAFSLKDKQFAFSSRFVIVIEHGCIREDNAFLLFCTESIVCMTKQMILRLNQENLIP